MTAFRPQKLIQLEIIDIKTQMDNISFGWVKLWNNWYTNLNLKLKSYYFVLNFL